MLKLKLDVCYIAKFWRTLNDEVLTFTAKNNLEGQVMWYHQNQIDVFIYFAVCLYENYHLDKRIPTEEKGLSPNPISLFTIISY